MGARNASRDRVGKISSKGDRTQINSLNVKVRKHKEMNLSSNLQDVVMLVVFCMLSYFNYAVLLNATSSVLKYIHFLMGS